MRRIDYLDGTHGRTWRAVYAPTLAELTSALDAPTPEYILLVCADTTPLPGPALIDSANRMLASGAGYVCCWGPGCERLHDCVDEASEYRGVRGDGVIMTTWHDDESLEEAAWFATHAAIPDRHYRAAFDSVLLAVAGPAEWFERLTTYLTAGAPTLDEA